MILKWGMDVIVEEEEEGGRSNHDRMAEAVSPPGARDLEPWHLGPWVERAHHRPTPRPSVDGIRSKALRPEIVLFRSFRFSFWSTEPSVQ